MQVVTKPKKRGKLRQLVGREYFCWKERMRWKLDGIKFSQNRQTEKLPHTVINHGSTLLRKLDGVDMVLQQNKIKNLELAIAKIDGVIIKPGETFSIWKLVGRPTKSKGYLEGLTLSNGELGKGIGGGLCQLGNLIYWMAIHSQLKVARRWRHSYDVFPDYNRTLPFGSGATLSYNYIDLQLKNVTNYNFQINLWLTDKNLHGSIACSNEPDYAYRVFEKNHRFDLQWWGGYTRHNEIWRAILDKNHELLDEELVTENHAVMMYNPLLSGSN